MKKFFYFFIIFISTSGTSIASDYYVGIDFSQIEVNTGVTNISSTLDEDDTLMKFTYGYNVDSKLSFETFYIDFGEASLSGNAGSQFSYQGDTYQFNQTATISLSADSFGFGGRYKINDQGESYAYLLGGLHRYDVKIGVSSASASSNISDSGVEPYFGIGYNYSLTSDIKFNAAYQNYQFEDSDISGFVLGIKFNY